MTRDEKKQRTLWCLQQSSHGENCSGLHLEFFSNPIKVFAALQPACSEEIFPLESVPIKSCLGWVTYSYNMPSIVFFYGV